jgi:hypothetical protein
MNARSWGWLRDLGIMALVLFGVGCYLLTMVLLTVSVAHPPPAAGTPASSPTEPAPK